MRDLRTIEPLVSKQVISSGKQVVGHRKADETRSRSLRSCKLQDGNLVGFPNHIFPLCCTSGFPIYCMDAQLGSNTVKSSDQALDNGFNSPLQVLYSFDYHSESFGSFISRNCSSSTDMYGHQRNIDFHLRDISSNK